MFRFGHSQTKTSERVLPAQRAWILLDVCREKGIEPYRSFFGRFKCAPKPETLDGQSCPPSARPEALRDRRCHSRKTRGLAWPRACFKSTHRDAPQSFCKVWQTSSTMLASSHTARGS